MTGDATTTAKEQHRLLDAMLWFLAPIVLAFQTIGRASGDGIEQARSYEFGHWHWNPNHLLYEPTGAAWMHLVSPLLSARAPVDRMVPLSLLSSAVTLFLFRGYIASAITPSRMAANVATAWVAFTAAYLGLSMSGEVQMLQMPWLALAAAAVLRFHNTHTIKSAVVVACAFSMATLFYISNVVAAAATFTLLLILAYRSGITKEIRIVVLTGSGMVALTALSFLSAWKLTASMGVGFLDWLLSYAGGIGASRIAGTYGIHGSVSAILIAVQRAIYGTALAIVDISALPSIKNLHENNVTAAIIATVLCLATGGTLLWITSARLRATTPFAILLAITWFIGFFVFGIYWNNSDDQFFFQMSLVFGLIVASAGFISPWLIVITVAMVVWNSTTIYLSTIAYPRSQYMADVRSLIAPADFFVYPGFDDLTEVLSFTSELPSNQRFAMTTLAASKPAQVGIPELVNRIRENIMSGREVQLVDIVDGDPTEPPWKYLSDLGYDRVRVNHAIDSAFAVGPARRAGPFTSRQILRLKI